MDPADIGTVRRLNELLDSEREARKHAENRAEQFAKKHELAATVDELEGKIEALTSQVGLLTDQRSMDECRCISYRVWCACSWLVYRLLTPTRRIA